MSRAILREVAFAAYYMFMGVLIWESLNRICLNTDATEQR